MKKMLDRIPGNEIENSDIDIDIDIYIITKNDTTWRERGNKLVDGYLIEYFINPIKKINDYMEKKQKIIIYLQLEYLPMVRF